MLKKTIQYTDFNGVKRSEDFYFNLTEAELMELELSRNGGLTEMVRRITNTQDAPEILKVFKEIILKSVGVKSDDGKRFIKSEAITEEFKQTNAYSVLFMELLKDDKKAAAFINGIIPGELRSQIEENQEEVNKQNLLSVVQQYA